mmetsp:Transcript_29314/g.62309  ORF Transcript_29314/g.62309 Transcript_29314/m.62309 type:complete len:217 (-) Transcript_29314:247-897(-)
MASCNLLKRKARSVLPLSAAVALLGTLSTPAFAFRAAPSITLNCAARQAQHVHRRPATTTTLHLSSPDEFPINDKQEQEMMDAVLREQQIRQVQQEAEKMPPADASQNRMDPLIASLTGNDESTPTDTRPAPLFGEIPVDGTLFLTVPATVISVLGFIFGIVVAFNSRDTIVQEFSEVDQPTPTVVQEGKCRGLCSSQDEDLDGLRNFMKSISTKD